MIVGYLRVSTDNQDLKSQKVGIDEYCKQKNIKIERWVEEKISGTKTLKERRLGSLVKQLKSGDTLIVSEISRLGRSSTMVINTVERILNKGITLVSIKQKLELAAGGNAMAAMMSKLFVFFSALYAEMERELMRERVKEGIKRRQNAGLYFGGTKGTPRSSPTKPFLIDMISSYKKGKSLSDLSKRFNFSPSAISKALKKEGVQMRERGSGRPVPV